MRIQKTVKGFQGLPNGRNKRKSRGLKNENVGNEKRKEKKNASVPADMLFFKN